ncbi:MAG: ABC transporter ATP-binding protein [Theionarchaea archaeon]|nr:ABC transporter ATP-binding protein [Theionarchaea archaeon]MBU7021281.1 ABC transporter ATP-binding protein [Theionarchaea archaeon]MBU7041453.1 ABC transporter ATP-binding protein [Theionarchaea archaeon]
MIIETRDLTKYYGKIRGVENLSFSIEKGEIFGFLGPNGAGKTTTIRTLLGFLKPTRGKAFIFGENVEKEIVKIKEKTGYIPGEFALYGDLTAKDLLKYFGKLRRNFDEKRLERLLEIFELPLNRKVKGYSRGMKQKLSIVQAFMHNPELIIMDEPTAGLDPLLQGKFYDFLREEKKEGKTMFISSHILTEVEKISDRVGIIRDGNLITLENVDSLKSKKGKVVKVKTAEKLTLRGIETKSENGWTTFVVTKDMDDVIKKLAKFTIKDIEIGELSLEEIFLHYYR